KPWRMHRWRRSRSGDSWPRHCSPRADGSEVRIVHADDEPGFGVYIHWPFCAQKCPYCDFNSHVRIGGWDEARFLAAYLRELNRIARLTDKRTVTSIFFGGGTPSLMQASTVGALLDRIGALWP